jgi:hypothetical protein
LIVNTNISETLNPPFNFTQNISDFDFNSDKGKNIELILSDYSLNSGLFTLFMMNIFKININSEILPENFPVKINTTSLNIIFNGMSEKYGEDIPAEMFFKIINPPTMNFFENEMRLFLTFDCQVNVLPEGEEKQLAIRFSGDLSSDFNLKILEKGNVELSINKVQLKKISEIESNIEKADLENVQEFVNFVLATGVPILNKDYLRDLKINLPEIDGVDISDINLFIKENFVDLHLKPNFEKLIKNISNYILTKK